MRATCLLLSLLASTNAFSTATALRRTVLPRTTKISLGIAVPADVAEACPWEDGTYLQSDVEDLWEALIDAYESEPLANAACKQTRGTILCPIYCSPGLIANSKNALISVLGSEADAAEVMGMNPAILTCGEELYSADPEEIKRLAKLRQQLDKIPPSFMLGSILVVTAIIGTRIALTQMGQVPYVTGGFPVN